MFFGWAFPVSIETFRSVNTLLLLVCAFVLATVVEAGASNANKLLPAEQNWLSDHPEVTVAFDGNFPPYSFLNDEGELEGFSVDVFKLISEQLGFSIRVYPQHVWEKLYQAAKAPVAEADNIDVVATMVDREQRSQWFNFSPPYIYKSLVIIDREDDNRIQQRGDIAGKTIALVKNYQYVNQIISEFPSVKVLYVDSMLEAFNAVSVGDADATVSFLSAGHYYRNKYLLTNLKYAAVYDKQNANESIAIRKGAPELAGIIIKGLKAIPEGKLQALRAKWLPVDYMENLVEINLTEKERVWIKNNPVIRLGVDPEFAPFEFIEDGQYRGMASDYIKLLNQRLNLNMRVVKGATWSSAVYGAEHGQIDILPAVGVTAERLTFFNFTDPYLQFYRVIVTRTDAPFISGLGDIAPLTVAVQMDSSHHGYLREHFHQKLDVYETQQKSLMAVSGGQADAFVGNVASASYWIRKLNLTNLKIAAPVSTEIQSLHFAVRKDWPELRSILQKGLASISTRQKKLISEKWLTVKYDPVVDYTLLWKIIAAFSLLVSVIFIWNLILKRQVRLRTSELNYSANYDQLSGLPNRFLIMDRLQQFLSEGQRNHDKVAILSIDIDDFKKINDGFDHKTGDNLIQEVSQRLQLNLRESDSIGHLGADHFLIIQNRITEVSDAAILSEKLLACLNQSFTIDGNEITISASLGISVYPDDGTSVEELLKHANAATQHAKNRQRGAYTFYTKNLIQNIARRLDLDRHMRGALERNEFSVFYQPKVEAKTRKIVSFEALIRWFSPELGMVSPVEFIPIAEKNGLIEPLGSYVIEQALAQLAAWQQRYDSPLSMAVNLSPVQFRSGDLISEVESTLLKNGLSGRHIEFEITEGVLLADYPNVEEVLKRLESLGVNLSMDDFGTGYSSMSYLRKYKFDLLKIDGEFINDIVRDNSDQKLVSATIAMAHGLGMKVVAERIETEEQYVWLTNANCDYLQGWLFGKAATAEDVTELLDNHFSKTEAS